MASFIKNQKNVIRAWALYDWANSAYFLVISTAIFPVYFTNFSPENIDIGGFHISNTALYSFAVSFSYIIIAILSPLLSGIADYGDKKKWFLRLFTLIGSLACMLLYFFKGESSMWIGAIAFVVATIGCAGALVFYNAYLPIIASEDKYDSTSAKGYAYGYVGSVLLLIFILIMIQKPEWFGITDAQLPARIGFVLVGLWWLGFAQITFKHMPSDSKYEKKDGLLKKGFAEIASVYMELKNQPNIKRFLWSLLFYFSGVQTVIYVATIFADKELQFESSELISVVILLQVVAIVGAYLFSWISKKHGNKMALNISIALWILICCCAFFVHDKGVFYGLSFLVGLALGGIQPLSRSSFSKLIPDDEEVLTSYFSFYDVVFKLSIVLGTFSFGFINFLTGSLRYSILILILFFGIGMVLLRNVQIQKD